MNASIKPRRAQDDSRTITNRRAQIQGQVFIYILAIVVVGLLLLFGTRSIISILHQACDVQEVQFKTTLETVITQSIPFGSSSNEYLDAPCDFVQVCFADTSVLIDPAAAAMSADNFFINNALASHVRRNVFLVRSDASINTRLFFEPAVAVAAPSNIVCVNKTNGKFGVFLEGKGKNVMISPIATS